MKKITLLFLLLSLGKAYAQRPNDYNNNRPNYSNNRVDNYSKGVNDDDYTQIRIVDTSRRSAPISSPIKPTRK